ncbi:MAG: alpha,alpha-trehalase TreF [Chitinispirillaceae bacterium]|nr:alpha,alpha-trehalase TreF [Chitinispirillaceae bacterium]
MQREKVSPGRFRTGSGLIPASYAAAITPFFLLYLLFLPAAVVPSGSCQVDPEKTYGTLFREVQRLPVFRDSKKFPDCKALFPPREIVDKYEREKRREGFDLRAFVAANFDTLQATGNDTVRMLRHIDLLWSFLERPADGRVSGSSLIPLPHPYIVPGGRFREVYYWDSYFTMLGLQKAGKTALMRNIVDNFCFLIDSIGHIPNGNRTYYASRSQPPFFTLMVELLAEATGRETIDRYLPWLEKEHAFWMKGKKTAKGAPVDTLRVVTFSNGDALNRYYDARNTPRPESFKEDVELAGPAADKKALYRNIRAAAESGWDFSSRWFGDRSSLDSIHTIDILPVDLNCLLYRLETLLADASSRAGRKEKSGVYARSAERRKRAIMRYCWDETSGFFFDYDYKKAARTGVYSMAGVFPLYGNIADSSQAAAAIKVLNLKLLKAGGFVTTDNVTGQQWDAPNGWAPLQWIGYVSLRNYGRAAAAREAAARWTGLNIKTFIETGRMMEKYNVVNLDVPGGGGEYDLQDGFGWTNGVFLALWEELKKSD